MKNAEGNDSPATCQRDMMLKFARWLEKCGCEVARDADGVPLHKIEIDPCFALGPAELCEKIGSDFVLEAETCLEG